MLSEDRSRFVSYFEVTFAKIVDFGGVECGFFDNIFGLVRAVLHSHVVCRSAFSLVSANIEVTSFYESDVRLEIRINAVSVRRNWLVTTLMIKFAYVSCDSVTCIGISFKPILKDAEKFLLGWQFMRAAARSRGTVLIE